MTLACSGSPLYLASMATDVRAAPPDDGHRGTATLPDETLGTGDAGDGPPLNQDPSRGVGTTPTSKAPGWISVLLLLLLGLAFYALMRG